MKKETLKKLRKSLKVATLGLAVVVGSTGFLTGCGKDDETTTPSNGKSAYELAVDNGFVGTVEDWLASLKGEPANGVEDVMIDYEYSANGTLYSVVTIIYTDGTMDVVKSEVPKKVASVQAMYYTHFFPFTQGVVPPLRLFVQFDDGTSGDIFATPDMIVNNVDFSTIGEKTIELKVHGVTFTETIVVTDFFPNMYELDSTDRDYYPVGTTINEILLKYDYNGTSYYGPLNLNLAKAIYNSKTYRKISASEVDLSKPSRYNLDFELVEGSSKSINLEIYDTKINNIKQMEIFELKGSNLLQLLSITVDFGDADAIKNNLLGKFLRIYFYEPVDGELTKTIPITEDMLDTSEFNVNVVGVQNVNIKYGLEGQDVSICKIPVIVERDLSTLTLIDTYTMEGDANTVYKVYSDGVVVLSTEYSDTQYTYDVANTTNGILKVYVGYLGGYHYFKINTLTKIISVYVPEGKPMACYKVVESEVSETEFYILELYNINGSYIGVSSQYSNGVIIPDTATDVTFVNEKTIKVFGTHYVIGEDFIVFNKA